MRNATIAFAAFLVLASSSLVRADGYTDIQADAMRNHGPIGQELTTKPVALPQQAPLKAGTSNWMDFASQTHGGGY
jgi:hypothetical protein